MNLLEMVHLNDEVYGSIGGRCSVFIHDMPYSPRFQWLPSIQRIFILVVLYRTAWTCMAPSSNPTESTADMRAIAANAAIPKLPFAEKLVSAIEFCESFIRYILLLRLQNKVHFYFPTWYRSSFHGISISFGKYSPLIFMPDK